MAGTSVTFSFSKYAVCVWFTLTPLRWNRRERWWHLQLGGASGKGASPGILLSWGWGQEVFGKVRPSSRLVVMQGNPAYSVRLRKMIPKCEAQHPAATSPKFQTRSFNCLLFPTSASSYSGIHQECNMVRKIYMMLRTQQVNTDKSNCHKEGGKCSERK